MKLKRNKGFTLIEILIALSIISIITMALFTAIASTVKGNIKSEVNIKLMNMAQSEIENIRQLIKEEKPIILIDDINKSEVEVTIGNKLVINKKNKNDTKNYYESILITKENITGGNISNYLYTIKVIVNNDIQRLNNNQGKEIITKVFSKKNY